MIAQEVGETLAPICLVLPVELLLLGCSDVLTRQVGGRRVLLRQRSLFKRRSSRSEGGACASIAFRLSGELSLALVFKSLHDVVFVLGGPVLLRDPLAVLRVLVPVVPILEIDLQLADRVLVIELQDLVDLLRHGLAFDKDRACLSHELLCVSLGHALDQIMHQGIVITFGFLVNGQIEVLHERVLRLFHTILQLG